MNELKEGEIDWEGCDYSKCGRTDRGVSAFGQVIGIRVRSNRPLAKREMSKSPERGGVQGEDVELAQDNTQEETDELLTKPPFDHIKDELPYIQLLNRVLPEDIRMLAWCPSPPPDFSARFSCRERRYRYFFTQPAFAPVPGDRGLQITVDGKPLREGWLDIEAMQDAAKRYEGLHDFRNLCKIDPSKQITNFERRIFHASIQRVDPRDGPVGYVGQPEFGRNRDEQAITNGAQHGSRDGPPVMYTFDVHGSAFLWHQVRNLVAVLFLVGQGLEPPSIVSDLLDITKNPTRPKYEMATDAPLVLWDCIFPADISENTTSRPDALEWIYVGDDGGRETNKKPELDGGDGKFGRGGIMDALWEVWHKRKIDEVLAGSLLDIVAKQGRTRSIPGSALPLEQRSARVFDGGHMPRMVGKYIPVMQKDRMETVEVINARYAERKNLDKKAAGSETKAEDADE